MAKTIDEGFRTLRRNLEITNLQAETTSTRQQNVRDALKDDFTILDTFLTGSYQRNTMIAPLSEADIDIFIVLDPKYYAEAGQSSLLTSVRTALRKTYTRTPDISPDGQAVTITFSDFKVDVVPGFYRNGGGFLIPDTQRKRWIATDPKKHVTLWSAANTQHNGDLVPLIKMIKGWNKSRQLLRSFHLETLALSVLTGVKISDFPSGVRFFFDKARAKIPVQVLDPAGYGGDVGAYLSAKTDMDNVVAKMTWAYEQAHKAEQLASEGNIRGAFERWAAIFKDYFPAYG